MHCSVIEHGYDVIEFSNCSTEERGVSLGGLRTENNDQSILILVAIATEFQVRFFCVTYFLIGLSLLVNCFI